MGCNGVHQAEGLPNNAAGVMLCCVVAAGAMAASWVHAKETSGLSEIDIAGTLGMSALLRLSNRNRDRTD